MIQGYRMAGPPPHGEPPRPLLRPSASWPVVARASSALAVAVFVGRTSPYAVVLGASGADADDDARRGST